MWQVLSIKLGCAIVISCVGVSFFMRSTGGIGLLLFCASLVCAVLICGVSSLWFGVGVWMVFISGLLVLFLFFCSANQSLVDIPWCLTMVSVGILSLCYISSNPGSGISEPLVFFAFSPFVVMWFAVYLLIIMVVAIKATPLNHGASRSSSP